MAGDWNNMVAMQTVNGTYQANGCAGIAGNAFWQMFDCWYPAYPQPYPVPYPVPSLTAEQVTEMAKHIAAILRGPDQEKEQLRAKVAELEGKIAAIRKAAGL
jgi:hypothetical protein